MGVMPLQFHPDAGATTLQFLGDERIDVTGIDAELRPQQSVGPRIFRANGRIDETALLPRIDTPVEVDYFRCGGILPMYCGTCWHRWMGSGECIGAATKRQTRAGNTRPSSGSVTD
jgi:aconitase A